MYHPAPSMDTPIPYRGYITKRLFVRAQWLFLGKRWLGYLAFPAIFIVFIFSGWPMGDLPLNAEVVASAITFLFPLLMILWAYRQWIRIFNQSPYLREPVEG